MWGCVAQAIACPRDRPREALEVSVAKSSVEIVYSLCGMDIHASFHGFDWRKYGSNLGYV